MTYNMFNNNLVCNIRVTAENFTVTESTVKECTLGQMVQNLMDTSKMTKKKDLEHSHSQVATNLRFVQSINQLHVKAKLTLVHEFFSPRLMVRLLSSIIDQYDKYICDNNHKPWFSQFVYIVHFCKSS